MANTSWVDLLSSKQTNEGHLLITDNTPTGVRHSSETHVLRCQVASLLKDKQRLTQDAVESRETCALLEGQCQELRTKLQESRNQSEEVCCVLEEQSKLISELSQFQAENSNQEVAELSQCHATIKELEKNVTEKEKALEGVYAHVQELRSEVSLLSAQVQSPSNTLLKNLERLTLRNAEMSENIAATQHSRSLLERELASLQQKLAKEESRATALEQRASITLTLEEKLKEQEKKLYSAQEELQHLKHSQLASIDAKCQEVVLLRNHIEEQLSLAEQERTQLQGQLSLAEQERTQLQGQLSLAEQERTQLQGQLSLAEQERTQLQGELSLAKQERTQLQGQLSLTKQERTQLQGQLSLVEQERTQLQGQLSLAEQERTQLHGQLSLAEQERTQMQGQLSLAAQERSLIETELKQIEEELTLHLSSSQSFREERDSVVNRLKKIKQHYKQQQSGVKGQLELSVNELKNVRNELEAIKKEKIALKHQVCSLEGRLSGRGQLVNEMRALLEQRASRITHLEGTIERQKSITLDTVDLLDASKDSLGSEVSVNSSNWSQSRFSSAQAEVVHLKQRLAESRQLTVRLEVQCAQLRTEGARLLGSQQALVAIKQQLLAENKGQRSFKEIWEREKDDMTNQITSLRNELNKTQQLMSFRDDDSVKVVSMETELDISKHEVSSLKTELRQTAADLNHITLEFSHVTILLDSECSFLQRTTAGVENELAGLLLEQQRVQEKCTLTHAVNSKRSSQIKEKETELTQLMAQVTLLRAKKSAVSHLISNELSDHELQLLKGRLKREKIQTNFVRLKLGYVLRELRLYKKLIVTMETREHELEEGFTNLQRQYLHCIEKLRKAEQLGFTT